MNQSKFWRSIKLTNSYLGFVLHAVLTCFALLLVLTIWYKSFGPLVDSKSSTSFSSAELSKMSTDAQAVSILRNLKEELKQGGAERMQEYFPEGACFINSLYGLAWTNLASEERYRSEAMTEIPLALAGQETPAALEPFRWDTQVRRGAFWLGQRSLLAGKYLALKPEPSDYVTSLTTEFHSNVDQIYHAVVASPTHQLESYDGMCWPADMPAGLASLRLHDVEFGTTYSEAITMWEDFNTTAGWNNTMLPPGRINYDTGQHMEPARGCANSLIVAIMASVDADYAKKYYRDYREHFQIARWGFLMFREYPSDYKGAADVDSGPILMGAGVTATGVGLAAARAVGDRTTERDIRDLSEMFGFSTFKGAGATHRKKYLGGMLPIGDAFLAWGYSIPRPELPYEPAPPVVAKRWIFHSIVLVALSLLIGQWILQIKIVRRRVRQLKAA